MWRIYGEKERTLRLSMPHSAEMTISAVINWEKIKRMEMKERMDKSSLME